MLLGLHVKNLALIDEEEITFTKGLNILSGETGAGKSIILGALSLALGGKAPKDFLRDADKEALVEATFQVSEQLTDWLRSMDITVDDNEVILTRKISATRATARINGESVPAGKLQEIGRRLIDIYGQHDHQSLLQKSMHLQFLDDYANPKMQTILLDYQKAYQSFRAVEKEMKEASLDESERLREVDFLTHEISEIESARLQKDEDSLLEEEYHVLSHAQKVLESKSVAAGELAITEQIGRAIRSLKDVESYDKNLSDIIETLAQAEDLISVSARSLEDDLGMAQKDEERWLYVQQRLDEINRLKDKYSREDDSISGILAALEHKQERLEKLQQYDAYLQSLKEQYQTAEYTMQNLAKELHAVRTEQAAGLGEKIRGALRDLNFLGVEFVVQVLEQEEYTLNGKDDVTFMISTNPGEAIRPLQEVASGGELSRIMLAMKTVQASGEEIETFVFDEIDAGISGRTAAAVSEKLHKVAMENQVICITHLPQIASMADTHYVIEKSVDDARTISSIRKLDKDGILEELSRMLGGAQITEATRQNAREMKETADAAKVFSES